ncbi:unnamed protein product [Urochloa humidicola]
MAAAAVHVLVFPWPLQGHINTFVPFSMALVDSGVHVTFLHTDHNLRRARCTAGVPRLRYLSIPDGLPDDHPRTVGDIFTLMESMWATGSAAYRALLLLLSASTTGSAGGEPPFPPVTCVVADGIMNFAIDIAEELGVPALAFRTASANSFSAYLAVPRLLELGESPFPVDDPVHGVPGMDGFLRRRDLPRLAPAAAGHRPNPKETEGETAAAGGVHPFLLTVAKGIADCDRARALVLNTAASLEGSAVAHIGPHMRDVFAIGPLHAMAAVAAPAAGKTSLWREDDGCVAWLDGHADRSVVYVSLGSLTHISHAEFTEFLSGLLATGYPFLWVLRPDMVAGASAADAELRRAVGSGKNVRVVEWAPQRDVLRHRAVGCFLTHSGWNSTMESVVEGVPMVCWPFFADQHINSRFAEAVWRVGRDMKDVCDRATVRSMVAEVMESTEIRQSVQALARQVRRDVAAGGSSETEFKRLVSFITELSFSRNQQ